ncbi:MAG TPA: heme o synthase [Candidatus Poseidoniales archaeon]|nr:heme o synthase [Candidatus Poseidoniales archaeon]
MSDSPAVQHHPGVLNVYLRLMKLRVVLLLQVTAISSLVVHDLLIRSGVMSGLQPSFTDTILSSLVVIVGGTLAAGGSNALNMVWERDIDPLMERTRHRPLPAGQITPRNATIFGVVIAVLGTLIVSLPIRGEWAIAAGFWTAFSVLYYVLVYTIWLKRRTPQNIVIGGVAGATPPLIGWAAGGATVPFTLDTLLLGSSIPWVLAALIFLWTPPHFWALSLWTQSDYESSGIPMMPNVHGVGRTLTESKGYGVLLMLLPLGVLFASSDFILLVWVAIACWMGAWYLGSIISIPNTIQPGQRSPQALASFKRSLTYLGLMFISIILAAAATLFRS